jgi:adenosylmethionine-8-amino-7-oxononanoate aminotransferase
MPPYVIDEAEGEHLARGALAALHATLAEEGEGAARERGVVDGV